MDLNTCLDLIKRRLKYFVIDDDVLGIYVYFSEMLGNIVCNVYINDELDADDVIKKELRYTRALLEMPNLTVKCFSKNTYHKIRPTWIKVMEVNENGSIQWFV